MKNYQLKNDEVILYRGSVMVLPNGKKEKVSKLKNVEQELILTNTDFVFETRIKKVFQKEEIVTEVYSIEQIKIYQDAPHILQNFHQVLLLHRDTPSTRCPLFFAEVAASFRLKS